MKKLVLNFIFCIQVLLVFLFIAGDRIVLPAWLQVAGRLHPLVLHLPIGFLIFLAIILFFQKHLHKDSLPQLIQLGLIVTSLFASVAALFGFFLSLQDDYGGESLTWHKTAGVLLSWFCYSLVLLNRADEKKKFFYGLGVVTLVTLIVAGHTGAVLTHGQNFVLAPILSREELTVENASVYEFAVQPILDRKCFSCHNEVKAKGGLVMTSIDKFKAGGEHGKPWVEGKPHESRMIKAFFLPLDHDQHMPPDGKPQLTPVEISTIEAWIKSGADFEKKLNQFADGDSLKFIVASFAASKAEVPEEEEILYKFPSVSPDVVEKLNTPYRSVFPLFKDSPALQADFFLKGSFKVEFLKELKSIANQLVVLNLSKMPVTDNDLSLISAFKNLEILNLNFTKVNGDGLQSLKSLTNLRSLSIAGTNIDAAKLETLLSLPSLREVYVWNTGVTEVERAAMSAKFPDLEITGSLFKDGEVLKLGKPRLENDGVVRKGELISLKHSMPGVVIRLSKDATDPDSTTSEVYNKPFSIAESMVLKARACKDGWLCSDVLKTTIFIEGLAPANVALESESDVQYPGKGASGLIDLQKGFSDILKEPSWLGYREGPFAASFDFGKSTAVKAIVISHAENVGGFVFPPQEVEIWAGNDAKQMKLLKQIKPKIPNGYTPNGVEALRIGLDSGAPYQYYKLVATPLARLPSWHNSKGERGWFFVDEVFFY